MEEPKEQQGFHASCFVRSTFLMLFSIFHSIFIYGCFLCSKLSVKQPLYSSETERKNHENSDAKNDENEKQCTMDVNTNGTAECEAN